MTKTDKNTDKNMYLIKRNGYEKNPEISYFFVYLSKEY